MHRELLNNVPGSGFIGAGTQRQVDGTEGGYHKKRRAPW